jgi:hypothetical protein
MAEIWASNLEAELLFVSEQAIESEAAEAGRNEAALTAETNEPLEEESSEEDWLYAALVSLDSTEDWPTEGQGGS